jgi:methylated-DNA-[protein]-cysteine S-methyltransferase
MMRRDIFSYRTIPSRFGPILLVWRQASGGLKVVGVILPGGKKEPQGALRERFPGARPGSHAAMDLLADKIGRFLQGEPVRFSLRPLDLEACTPFQRRVLPAEFQVPRGRVTTYGRLADRIGAPGAARAVGNALSHNPFPLIIPCHRCVRENGQLGGFRGGLAMKRALLEMEGIDFGGSDRVARKYFWNR